jgi:hypothetical protein
VTLNKSFFLLTAAFSALCTLAVALTVALSAEAVGRSAEGVAVVAFAVAVAALWAQGRHDLDAVLTMLSVFLLLATVCLVIYLFVADDAGRAPKIAVVLTGGAAVGLGVTTYRRQRSESRDFPNILAARFESDSIFETEGVQFTGIVHPGGNGSPHHIVILLENCFDAPRQVTIRLDAASAAKHVRVQPEHTVMLGAAEASRVTFPVITQTDQGLYPIYLSMAVAGREGQRVRLWRAQEATERVKTATTVALLAFGHLAVGGGIRFTVGPLPDDLWATPLPPPTQESLWQPRLGTVPLDQSASRRL